MGESSQHTRGVISIGSVYERQGFRLGNWVCGAWGDGNPHGHPSAPPWTHGCIAHALARDHQIPAPLSGLGFQLWQAASRAAGEGASVSEIVRWIEQMASTDITPGARVGA